MKHILLAKKSKRIFAALIDFLLITISSVTIFLTLVFPFSFNEKLYRDNFVSMKDILQESGLYFTNDEGEYTGKSVLVNSYNTVADLSNATVQIYDKTIQVNLSKDLYEYYTAKYDKFGHEYNLSIQAFEDTVLKIGSSNIASIDYTTYAITMIDPSKEDETVSAFLDAYTNAALDADKFEGVQQLKTQNTNLMLSSIALIIPVIVGMGLIFTFIVPACSKGRRSIGKHVFKLDVIASTSYQLKNSKLLLRSLVYTLIEVIGGVLSFGATFLITYTMFLFTKNRRSIHDFICKSVVIDGKDSVYFLSEKEEKYFDERSKNRNQ